jgi:hypothetical protein
MASALGCCWQLACYGNGFVLENRRSVRAVFIVSLGYSSCFAERQRLGL